MISQSRRLRRARVCTPSRRRAKGNSGNYFLHATQGASRDQGILQAYLPRFQLAGSHQPEAGAGADLIRYNADFRRTGYEALDASGQLISQTLFLSSAVFHLRDTEASSFLIDTWRLSKRLQLDLAIRQDWDRQIDSLAWSPRAAFSWSPLASGRTRISGGYSVTHDAVTMNMLGQPLDQVAVTTTYRADGTPVGPPVATTFATGREPLKLPRAGNWSVDLDRQIATHLYLTAKYLRRRGTDEFTFLNTLAPDAPPSLLPLPSGESGGVYQLTNLRRDDYDMEQVSIRQTLAGQFEWQATYTHSRALSNAVLDPNTAQSLQVLANLVPMPWDVPNRLLAWCYLPLPRKNWAVSALADLRTGYPFSVRDPSGLVAGAIDSFRYPLNFDLNIAIERMVTLRGYRFALRGGVDNLTNQANPTTVNNVTGTPQFLQFLGQEGRHFVVRIRFFGRANGK
ncbi:hypothetical protein SBA3_150005 [Candidatus Sulfopaludibacter sp. SbA3]|nr:hypothetical protein SBA3_150005 [Candidatus Sulfopaludibacter sp. SbA3]